MSIWVVQIYQKKSVIELFWNKRLFALYDILPRRVDMAADEGIMWNNGCRLFCIDEVGMRLPAARMPQAQCGATDGDSAAPAL